MNFATTLALGAVAGGTIVLGLPVGRMRSLAPTARTLLTASTVGVLLFLVWDVLTHAWEPIDAQLSGGADGRLPLLAVLFAGGIAAGLFSVVGYERLLERQRSATRDAVLPTRRLALLIAVGIGVHNFAEGLAIGQSAASGALGLLAVLVIGFALHNGTEGFGIVAPLAADEQRPSWGFLLLLGLIGGAPTFLGTAVGFWFASEAVSVLFLALAAGSILFVVIQLLGVVAKARRTDLTALGVFLGLLVGFATDAVVTLGGA
ncbi:ZIP family metal transporter [Amnibacterium kyonggiense]|uniref:ZIP family zinc transporter n=1 Tax=Amnibacterium kyonggiense TaxID=595671 RepID=A0A4R7FT43_9MICO|nr:ZIP family metal transporter [Amnibacterium kyonggiense]TDS81052.1 ZIP family zinc transporter [Amnibacterium kyonggiense]